MKTRTSLWNWMLSNGHELSHAWKRYYLIVHHAYLTAVRPIPSGYLLTFRPDLAKKFSYYWKSTPVHTWTLSVGDVQLCFFSFP